MLATQDFNTHMAYAAQQCLDGYSEAVKHAMDRKTRFDRRVLDLREGEVVFKRATSCKYTKATSQNPSELNGN